MSPAMNDLKHEHDALLHALELLDALGQRLRHPERGQAVDPQDLQQLTDFFREFADRCHHGKEEGWLFPALGEAGLAPPEGLQQALLAEHVQGREALRAMQAEAAQPGPAFADAAERYAALLRSHIAKENAQLLPWVDAQLDATRLGSLAQGFEQHEAQVMGAGRHEALHALLGSLRGRYLPQPG